MATAHVQLDKISKRFRLNGKVFSVLEDISLEANQGETISILGRSGSGKTTLLNIIAGLEKPDAGHVNVEGNIGYVPQKDLLLHWRTLLKNVLLPIEIGRAVTSADVVRATKLLERMGLADFIQSYPKNISGGMRQKVSLARALVQNPDVILFDEPFSAIDFDTRLRLGKEIHSQIKNEGKVGIFVTHNIEEAIAMGNKVILLSGGKPARIVYQAEINIGEEFRDPVNIRKSEIFQRHFDVIWQLLSKEA